MALLALAVLAFALIHLVPAVPPVKARVQQALGRAYGPVFGIAVTVALVLIVVGWRAAGDVAVYEPAMRARQATVGLLLLAFLSLVGIPPLAGFFGKFLLFKAVKDKYPDRILIASIMEEYRKDAWVEQLECANKAVFEFLGQIDEEAVVVLTSDHGPDSTFVIESADPDDLTTDLLRERLPTLTAVRMPESCRGTLPADIHTVNLFRSVLGCLSGTELDMLDSRYFAASFGGSIVELKYANELAD